jgi:excisionase family DNA binding protein
MQTAAMQRTLFSVREVADRWGVHPDTVKRCIRRHSLRAVRIGGRHMVRITEIERAEKNGLEAHRGEHQ